MDKIRVLGGHALSGRVEISGAKNAALPAMAASLLTSETVHLENIPCVRDVLTAQSLLREMGVETEVLEDGKATLKASKIKSQQAPYELVKTMRAAILVLGPLVSRFKKAKVSLPGGCAIGARPIDLHLTGLERMGATCDIVHGYVEASTEGLRGSYNNTLFILLGYLSTSCSFVILSPVIRIIHTNLDPFTAVGRGGASFREIFMKIIGSKRIPAEAPEVRII